MRGAGSMLGEILYAAHRPDLPSLENQDPSVEVGAHDAPSIDIVVLGDSSVTAPGVEPLDAAWPRRVANHLADRYRVRLRSVAVGGAKVSDVLRDQLSAALAAPADIALVSVGANDALRGTTIAVYERDLDDVVRRLAARVSAVGLCGVGDIGTIPRLPTFVRSIGTVRARAFDRAIARVAARNPGVLKSTTWGPLWERFDRGDPEIFAADQFHASGEGHAVFAASIIPVVDRLVASLEPELSARRERRESST
ncbi:MAG TPA: GDSL-type esterase/lipase family protein [Acidimicrobiia bacterium]